MATKKASPGFTGAVSDALDAVSDYARAGRDEARESASPTGNREEDAQLNETSSAESSNAGKQAQSTDHMNQY